MRKLIFYANIILIMFSCSEDVSIIVEPNVLSGKLKSYTYLSNDSVYPTNYLSYNLETLQLEYIYNDSIGDGTNFIYESENLIILENKYYKYEIVIEGDRIIEIRNTDFNGTFQNAKSYFSNQLDSVIIDASNKSYIQGVWDKKYDQAKIYNLNFENNYNYFTASYRYQDFINQVNEIIIDTVFLEYTNFQNTFVAPYQFPLGIHSNLMGLLSFNLEDPLYMLRLAGYKMFEDNQYLVHEAENETYTYSFNNKNQLVEMSIQFYSDEPFIIFFEYYE
ncbi:MAG: hypothetical protein R2728_06925 [Chitinophagales bacterium]